MKIRAFITHKKAETFVDCQDRFGVNNITKSIAVSDGMSQSWQQKIWAQLLVEKYVNDINWFPNNETIKPLCTQWREKVVEFIENLKASEAPVNLVYRNERNLADGKSAGATFVGIRFDGIEWKGYVLGDSCLIEWNGDEATFYTSQDVESFDNHPDYFDSNILNEGKGAPISICGVLENGTCLLLVSDPFSDFLFEHHKQGDVAEYMQQLIELSSHEQFEALVEDWRKAGMHNDDTTLVIVEPDNSDGFSIDANTFDDINRLIDEEKKLIEEDKKEETEQELASISNEPTEDEVIGDVTETEEKIEATSVEQIEMQRSTDFLKNDVTEDKIDNEINSALVPVEAKLFVDELLKEYKKATEKPFGQIIYYFSEKAVEKAGYSIFKKYNIFKK